MPVKQTEPFSDRLEDHQLIQSLQLFRIYNYYRLVIAVLLLITYSNEVGKASIGLEYPLLFVTAASVYFLVAATMAILFQIRARLGKDHIILNIFIDIATITLLIYASGGVGNGLSNLMIVVIAAGSILLTGAYALMFAALASIALMLGELYRFSMNATNGQHYVQSGMLGLIFFATAIFIKQLAKRIRVSENLTQRQNTDIVNLEKLNNLIIQRMRTGIVVTSMEGNIQMMNEAALELLTDSHDGERPELSRLPQPLLERLTGWLNNPQVRTSPFRSTSENPKIQANFTSLRAEDGQDVLIFLEDSTKVMQQAQQLKLASLGQLTASIAHEIRNPLGAISHASQLLSESTTLGRAEDRLADIIQDHARRMNITIENILELSRRHNPAPSSIKLRAWLKDFAHAYNQSEQNPGEFAIDIEPASLEIQVDPTQFSQVVTNLCNNGLRYSQEHSGKALITIKGGINPESEQPYLDIIDSGPGIATEALPHLFEPFYTTASKGTGLGLYISRELCESNHARLEHIESHAAGCCFRIIFPHPRKLAA